MKQGLCECCDTECPTHVGGVCDVKVEETILLFRVGIGREGEEYRLCDACALDYIESGVYAYPGKED